MRERWGVVRQDQRLRSYVAAVEKTAVKISAGRLQSRLDHSGVVILKREKLHVGRRLPTFSQRDRESSFAAARAVSGDTLASTQKQQNSTDQGHSDVHL
jgi:hypothetical protein